MNVLVRRLSGGPCPTLAIPLFKSGFEIHSGDDPSQARRSVNLIEISLLLLTACADKNATSAACPATIRPSTCAVGWYAQPPRATMLQRVH